MSTPTAESTAYLAHQEDRERLIQRLARVEGQLRGVQRMIREGDDCERVVQQLAAARGGLHGAFCDLIACAFESKLAGGVGGPGDIEDMRGEVGKLTDLLKKYA